MKELQNPNRIFFFIDIITPFYGDLFSMMKSKESDIDIKIFVQRKIDPDRTSWHTVISDLDIYHLDGFNLLKRTFELKPNLIFISNYKSFYNFILILYCIYFKKKYLLGPHEILKNTNQVSIKFIFKLLYYRTLSIYSSATITMGKYSKRLFSLFSNKYIYDIPYPVTLSRFKVCEKDKNEFNLLFCGRLVDFRRPDLVIDCFNIFLKKTNYSKNIKLFISGSGPLTDKCKNQIVQYNIQDHIIWLDEVTSWSEIPKVYNKIHILLSLQDYSGWGMIIPEAMASGVGIICTNTMESGNSLIINEYNGYLVDPNDIITASEKLFFYFNNRDVLRIHSMRSIEIIKTVSVDKIADDMLNICNTFSK
jgi:glycosyltransferase involved in cell wall biosynthesis